MDDEELYNHYNQEFDQSSKQVEGNNPMQSGSNDLGPVKMEPKINNSNEEMVTSMYELEIWKKAEQTRFKAYLKQLEIEYMNKVADEIKKKEDEREKQLKILGNELTILQTRLKKRANELESRENKLILLEEELKLKLVEVAKQMTNKDQEIKYFEKRMKDERAAFDKEKQVLNKAITEKEKEKTDLETAFRNYRKEVDESPLSMMRAEINKKNLELEEAIREKDRVVQEKDKLKNQNDKLKMDMIKIKKTFDQEKELLMKQRIDDIMKLQFEIHEQKTSQKELQEINDLKGKINKNSDNKKEDDKKPVREYKIISKKAARGKSNQEYTNDLERLIDEKNAMIQSGQYTENDPIIKNLDQRIRLLIDQN